MTNKIKPPGHQKKMLPLDVKGLTAINGSQLSCYFRSA